MSTAVEAFARTSTRCSVAVACGGSTRARSEAASTKTATSASNAVGLLIRSCHGAAAPQLLLLLLLLLPPPLPPPPAAAPAAGAAARQCGRYDSVDGRSAAAFRENGRASGFKNLGNTCFFGAAIVCYRSQVREAARVHRETGTCTIEGCRICRVVEVVVRLGEKNTRPHTEDFVFSWLEDSLNSRADPVLYERYEQWEVLDAFNALREALAVNPATSSFFRETYVKMMLSKTKAGHDQAGGRSKCPGLVTRSVSSVPYIAVLAPAKDEEITLVTALDQFCLSAERVADPKHLHDCEQCKRKKATVMSNVAVGLSVGSTLIVHVNRAQVLGSDKKQLGSMKFGETLDMTPFSLATRVERKENAAKIPLFNLDYVGCHRGSDIKSGHYFSFEKGTDHTWRKVDDDTVTTATLSAVLKETKNVVLLRYQKSA